jgi:hypothetical protein
VGWLRDNRNESGRVDLGTRDGRVVGRYGTLLWSDLIDVTLVVSFPTFDHHHKISKRTEATAKLGRRIPYSIIKDFIP